MMAFLLFELQKGEKSFWYPYFQVLPDDAECFWRWDQKVIKETQDPAIILSRFRNVQTYRESLENAMAVFRRHPDVFSQSFVTEKVVRRIEAWVDTRVFGSHNMPSCALIPFADAINHCDSWIQMNSVNSQLHPQGKQAPGGYCREKKYLIDFSVMYSDLSRFTADERLNIAGRFNHDNYQANQTKFEDCQQRVDAVKSGIAIWEVEWMQETFSDEDSDDELESESSEEEESKETKSPKTDKVDRLNSLKPFIDLEEYTLKVNDMQQEYSKKLHAIN